MLIAKFFKLEHLTTPEGVKRIQSSLSFHVTQRKQKPSAGCIMAHHDELLYIIGS